MMDFYSTGQAGQAGQAQWNRRNYLMSSYSTGQAD